MINGSMNRGDWGEFYTLVYLIGERVLCSADENLNRVPGINFPLIKVIRDEKDEHNKRKINNIEFVLENIKDVEIYFNSSLVRKMTSNEFKNEAELLCNDIPDDSKHVVLNNGKFNIPHGENFANYIYCQRLAAGSDDITDIRLQIHDVISGSDRIVGFSVKSYLGGAPTLLNASRATNFIYRVIGINEEQASEINSIKGDSKIIKRLDKIYSLGGHLEYVGLANKTFQQNLRKMDADMESMLSDALLHYYKDRIRDCKEVIEVLEFEDPLRCDIKGLYEYKFKRFLCAKALGLEPSREWSGEDDANGGYIVAKSDGEVVAFHLYDRDVFKKYLYENTYFEKGSTNRHEFASIYPNGEDLYINLNLQIRFKDRK